MEISTVSEYELKAVRTIQISVLMNITHVSVDLASNQGSQNPSLFSPVSRSSDGRFADEPSVSFWFSSHARPGIYTSVIEGLSSNDSLTGTNIGDLIMGYAGNDVLIGLRGNDRLNGGDGSDILKGGKDEDVLIGDFGDDMIVGGAGSDEFRVGEGFGIDTILDFANSEDIVSLRNLTFEQLSISQGTNGTLIRVASSGEIIASLIGVAPNLIGSEDFFSFVESAE